MLLWQNNLLFIFFFRSILSLTRQQYKFLSRSLPLFFFFSHSEQYLPFLSFTIFFFFEQLQESLNKFLCRLRQYFGTLIGPNKIANFLSQKKCFHLFEKRVFIFVQKKCNFVLFFYF